MLFTWNLPVSSQTLSFSLYISLFPHIHVLKESLNLKIVSSLFSSLLQLDLSLAHSHMNISFSIIPFQLNHRGIHSFTFSPYNSVWLQPLLMPPLICIQSVVAFTYTGTVANPSPITFYPTFNESVSFISMCFTDLRAVTRYWWDCCTAAIHGYLDVSLFFLFNTDIITVVQYFFVSQLLFCVLYIYVLFFPILISLWSLREPPKPSSLYLRWQHSYSLLHLTSHSR